MMKQLKPALFFSTAAVLLFAAFLFTGCFSAAGSNPTGDRAAKDVSADPAASANAGSPGGGNASFSAIVDGVKFSSNTGTGNLNAAFRVKGGESPVFFMLADPENPVQKLTFQLPDKTGSTTISILPKFSFEGYVTKDWVVYVDDGVTVNVTSISGSRISGTFSGNYKLENAKAPDVKQTIQITDGKFDIPFSTSADWKKMYHAE
ncbi:MAG TPA: hypothetical protein VK563_22915 [Puia sp.]|nr:hypothetical protein [Puia sp.]